MTIGEALVYTVFTAAGALASFIVPCAIVGSYEPLFFALVPIGAWLGWKYGGWQVRQLRK